ncbi:hypothetical protein BGZ49_001454 [Haplosporangium sp. Z 27]|nr:hypothetical protein BGZ49_001454 [Haplosporangium sp. Z 27]
MSEVSDIRNHVSKLLILQSITASNAQEVTGYLGSIHAVLISMPDPELHLTRALIMYIQQALDRVQLLCQRFMKPSLRFDFLVEAWCKCLEFLLRLPDGYAIIVGTKWEYSRMLFEVLFWLLDGIPIRNAPQSSSSPDQRSLDPLKVPKDIMPDEIRLTAMRCLILALPLDKSASIILEDAHDTYTETEAPSNDDRLIRTKKDEEVRNQLLALNSQAILGQMLVIVLNIAKKANLISLRMSALKCILKFLKFIETPESVAKWYPGLSHGLTESMLNRGLKEHHSILSEALYIWTFATTIILQDPNPTESTSIGTISGSNGLGETLMNMYKSKTQQVSDSDRDSTSQLPKSGYGSKEWMSKLDHALQVLFKEISPLRSHSHWKVRCQFGDMAYRILKDCQRSITHLGGKTKSSGVACFLLETLIGCTQDDYKEVYQPAQSFLKQLTESYLSQELINLGKEIFRERLMALPRVLHGVDETAKQRAIRILQGLVLFMGSQTNSMVNHQTLLTYIQPWINILAIEQLDQHNMDERGGILSGDETISKNASSSSSETPESRWNAWVQSHKGSGRKFGFPRRIHVHLREQATSNAFIGFLRQLGSTTDISIWVEELTSRLQQECRYVRENQGWFDLGSVSCVLMMSQILLGAHGIGLATIGESFADTTPDKIKSTNSTLRKRQRQVRRAARGVLEEYVAVLVECSQMSIDVRLRSEADKGAAALADRNAQDKKVALAKLLGLEEEEGFDIEQTEARIYDYKTEVMLQCLLLEGVASMAIVLGRTEFEMELVRVLYILLEHLGDQDSALVRDTAEATLEHVAFICQYDSIGDLIQANYDYVIQQVSQKIAFLGSNPKTPQVLWALIRVVGPPAISMLEDSVTEIFEALDHWKNQEDQIGEGLLKSLCEIVKVMSQAASSTPSSPSAKGSDGSTRSNRDSGIMMSPGVEFSLPDKPSKEVEEFVRTYKLMTQGTNDLDDEDAKKLREETKNMSAEEIKNYFTNLAKEAKEEEEKRLGVDNEDTDKEEDIDDEQMSFGDLRAKMPKPSKESQPKPPTKHQALCLRILNKAGYFLTASSPRMRILALEIIQGAIIVLKDRPADFHPAIYAFWPSIVGRVLKRSEKDVFYVSLRAIEVITLLAENASDFLRGHLMEDIWPYILKTLALWTRPVATGTKSNNKARILDSSTHYGQRVNSKSHSGQPRSQGRREASAKVFTLEHRLQMTTLESVAKIVRRIQIPVRDAWEMLLLARDMMLDTNWTLHWDVRLAASEVIKSMAIAGHGDSVFLALDEIIESQESGTNQVRFTTAELTDSLRPSPSSSSQPTPSSVRGNAARKRSFQLKANFQQQSSKKIEFTHFSNNSSNDKNKSKHQEGLEDIEKEQQPQKGEKKHDSQLNQKQGLPSQSKSQVGIFDQSPIVSDLASTLESTESRENGTPTISSTATETAEANTPKSRAFRSTTRSMGKRQRLISPEPTTLSQLVSGQRLPSVSQSADEHQDYNEFDSELINDQELDQIMDDLPDFQLRSSTEPEIFPTLNDDAFSIHGSINGSSTTEDSSPEQNQQEDLTQPKQRNQQQQQQRKDQTQSERKELLSPKKENVEVVLVVKSPRGRHAKRAEEKDRTNHLVIEVPPAPSKVKSKKEVEIEARGHQPRTKILKRNTRSADKSRNVQDSPSKNTRSRDHSYRESSSPSRRTSERLKLQSRRPNPPLPSIFDDLLSSGDEGEYSSELDDDEVSEESKASMRRLLRLGRRPNRLTKISPSLSPPPSPPPIETQDSFQELVGAEDWDSFIEKSNSELGASSSNNTNDDGVPPKKRRWRDKIYTPTIEKAAVELPTRQITKSTPDDTILESVRISLPKQTVAATSTIRKKSFPEVPQNNEGQKKDNITTGTTRNEVESPYSKNGDDSDVERLRGLWIKHKISWPLQDRNEQTNGKEQFRVEPYSANIVFGTALPLPKGALTT